MNRKTILVLLCVSCLSILTGCPTAKPTVTETIASIAPEETTSPLVDMETQDVTGSGPSNESIPSSTDNAEEDYANNCMLFVDDIEIEDTHYVRMDQQAHDLELPLTEILKVLGADVRWEDSGIVVVSYMDKTVRYDPNMWDFDLPFPPGTINGVRKVINGDLVVEWDTASNVLRGLMGATISVDHDGSVIYIDSRR